jgi:hypothetical protein
VSEPADWAAAVAEGAKRSNPKNDMTESKRMCKTNGEMRLETNTMKIS